MVTEHEKTLKGLQVAVQMEIDGKEYYQKVSQSSNNQLGRELLQSLAAIRDKRAWPKTDFQPDRGRRLKTIFAKSIKEIGPNIKAANEIDAIKTAMDMENKTYDFYKSQSQIATYDTERDFYENIAAEERGHYLVLNDYREYLSDPAGWFVKKEHPSLDGG